MLEHIRLPGRELTASLGPDTLVIKQTEDTTLLRSIQLTPRYLLCAWPYPLGGIPGDLQNYDFNQYRLNVGFPNGRAH